MLISIIVSLIYCAVCVVVFCQLEKQKDKNTGAGRYIFALMVAAAAAVRVYFALQNYWFPTDVGNFSAWGTFAVNHGFGEMYRQGHFIDYPPGYMYPLYILTALNNLLGFEYGSVPYVAVIKLPAMIADFGCAALLYKMAYKKQGKGFAQFAALAFLFMPVVITNSSIWGQIESYFILFVALSIWFASENKTIPAAISFAYALAIKPQAVLFGAVLLFYIIKTKSIKEFFKAAGTGLLSFYIIVFPFLANPLDIGWLAKLYPTSMGTYQYMCVNAYNFYYMLGLNWADSALFPQGAAVNFAVIALSVAVTGFVMLKNKTKTSFFATAAVPAALMFCFCTMMHERYIWPAMFFALAAWAASGKKMYLVFGLLIGTLNQLNTAWVLAMYQNSYWPTESVCKIVALLTVVTTVCYVAYLIKDTLNKAKNTPAEIMPTDYETDAGKHQKIYLQEKIHNKTKKGFFKKADSTKTAVAVITALYAAVALIGLGSTKAPQTYCIASEAGESFTVTFDTPADIASVWAYSGLGDENIAQYGRKTCGEFSVLWSADGISYNYLCDIEGQSVYTWKQYYAQAIGAKSVRVTAKNAGAVLHEIVFRDTQGNVIKGEVTDLLIAETNPYTAANAFDEQNTAPKDTGYYWSMYFDEIYHARTAYEQLHGMQIYETTHPPLGKIIISLGIALFGMTPFGWRIMGALCGIAMLPVVYLLAKELGGKKAGLCACLLVAADFMHLTQTRLATVDTFVVLFCLLTFLFMLYYRKTDFGSKKEWLYLFLSGSFMGCAVASKWNGAYPMVALAVVFFVILVQKYKNSGREKADRIYVAKTILLCFVVFAALPLVIYTLSYIPVINSHTAADYFRQLWGYQTHMYNYHANLEAEHFFSSMWYTWPLCLKPIWYSVANTANGWVSTISAFGNPFVWIVTPFAAVYCLYKGIRTRQNQYFVPSLAYFASYIPWIAVTRLCFIYHYFPCAMFGIVCVAMMIKDVLCSKPQSKKFVMAYIALCLVLFVVFLPVTTGWPAPKGYIEFLEFLPDWYFVN